MILSRGNLKFDTATGVMRAKVQGKLAPTPARLLAALARDPVMVSRERLLDVIWNGRQDGPEPAAVEVYICRLRGALVEIGADVAIVNHFGRGYSLKAEGETTAECLVPVRLWREAMTVVRRQDAALAARMEQVGESDGLDAS